MPTETWFLFPSQLPSYYIIFVFKYLYLLGCGCLTLDCNDFNRYLFVLILCHYILAIIRESYQRFICLERRPTILGGHSFSLVSMPLCHCAISHWAPFCLLMCDISPPQSSCPQYRSFALQDYLVPTLCYLHYRRKKDCLHCTGKFFLS